jgi:uncharacterized protein YprB with RNaseH-like and TPR domain
VPNNAWFCDLETTGLSAKSGDIILCAGFAPLEPDPATGDNDYILFKNGDVPDDDGIAVQIRDFMMERPNDAFFWWNGFKFDLPFIVERLRQYDQKIFAHGEQFDLKDDWKRQYPYLDGHLESAMEAAGVAFEKTPLDLSKNRRCADSIEDKEAWDYLTEHNIADIRGTREVYKFMYPEPEWAPHNF